MRAFLLACASLALVACSDISPGMCAREGLCLDGHCLPTPGGGTRYCAFCVPTTTCPSGLRWDRAAPAGLASQCVAATDLPDAGIMYCPPDGGVPDGATSDGAAPSDQSAAPDLTGAGG